MATVYQFCFHFNIILSMGEIKLTLQLNIVSVVVLVINLIIVYGLSDKIYL